MINAIIDGIGCALYNAFPTTNIYKDTVYQGISEPAFLISLINDDTYERLGGYKKHYRTFQVVYLGDDADGIRAVASVLPYALADIDVVVGAGKTQKRHGTNIKCVPGDGHTLTCTVDYVMYGKETETSGPLMMTLTQTQEAQS